MCIRKFHLLQWAKQEVIYYTASIDPTVFLKTLIGIRSGPADWTKKELLEKLAKFGGKFTQGTFHLVYYSHCVWCVWLSSADSILL